MAADFCISIGAKISEYLVEPLLIRPLRPIFCFRSIVDDFQDQNKKLCAFQERVENEVHCGRDNARVIYDHVEEWLKKVNASIPEVRRVEKELEKNKSCFRYSWCPNWTCHYNFSKQVSKVTGTMKTLSEEGNSFSSISHPPTLHQDIIGSSSSTAFMHSQSSKSAFDQIMEALKRDDVNLIGLYGKASSGKTTLAKQVGEEAKNLFDRVIMVPVSQHPQVRGIQGFIADFLNLPLDQLESEQGRAAKLQLRLRNGEKILIVLDDVGKEFCLGAVVGIPSVGCKILLTANAETHVPESMRTQKHVLLGALSEDEAWTLLKSIAGVGDEVRTHDVAKDALEECNGLPKAIVAMGAVLNGKGVIEWRETLQLHKAAKFKIIDSLKEGIKKLSLRQDRVNTKIKIAKQNVEEIYPDVEKWLKDVERVMKDVEQFEIELKKSIWCFDELGVTTIVEGLATCVKDLHEEGNFDQVSHPTPLQPDMRLLPSGDFLFSEAAKSAFDQILKALKTDSVNMIGLYGMGGIGKTTLASQVHNEVIRQNALAVMVTVSQKPDVGNMQDKIADYLDLELKKKTLDERAIELQNRLKNEKILITLDDIWKRFDFRSIGITLDDSKGCKILMTSRGRDVCSSMECQAEIQLHMFSEDESHNFFKKKAGLSNELELDDVAKQIVAECKCLPIALETVGATLKRKGKDEWVEALENLRNARLVDIIGVNNDEKNVYKCLRISYDYLNGQPQGSKAQFILLLCSLFPEDYCIKVEDLTRYAFGMKLFENVESVEDARRKVRVTIRFLRDSCLLLDDGGEKYVKMHDAVRDVLLWIGGTEPQERNTLTVRDDIGLKDLIRKKSFQNCKALSFTSDVIPKFSKHNKLEFPNLEIVLIFIKEDHEFVELGEGFFEHMKLLKVLDFRAEGRWRWRKCKFAMFQSLHYLEYLRTLMLINCECSNSSTLRDLGRLRILSLHDCKIDCGVEVVSGLKKLRLLDLSGLKAERRMFTSDVIETLVNLEELYGYTFERCKDKEGTSSRLSELKLPSNLVSMSAEVEDVRCLPTDFFFPNLQSYKIYIGDHRESPSNISQGRHLGLCGDIKDKSVYKPSKISQAVKELCKKLFPTVQVFTLFRCDGLYSLDAFSCPAEGFLQMLERLEVRECPKMEWLLKVGNVSNKNNSIVLILPLKILYLFILPELRHIWEGPTRLLSLCNLTEVNIISCPKLICIFSSMSLATSLQQLEILTIQSCPDLEEIFSRGDGDFTCCCCFTNLRNLKVIGCDKVKAIFPLVKSTGGAPHLHPCRLPKLENILLSINRQLEHIFGHQTQVEEGVECPSLQVLDVRLCPKISTTHFVATQLQAPSSKSYEDHYSMDNIQVVEKQLQRRHDDLPHNTIICFSFLSRVELRECNKLKQVFTTSVVNNLHLLKELIVERCNELEQVIGKVGDDDSTCCCCFTNLRDLTVSGCDKVKAIFPLMKSTGGAPHLHPQRRPCRLPKLKRIYISTNGQLEHIFGNQTQAEKGVECPSLQVLDVRHCPKISTTHFVATQLHTSSSKSYNDNYSMDNIQIVEERLRRRHDDLPQSTIICFSFLNRVELEDCNKLKQVFTTSLVTSLPLLKSLIVRRCNELEQVVGKVEDGKEPTIGVSFENLKILRVSHCGKLKTIFQISIAIPQLEELKLKSNSELEHVFGQSDWDCTWQCPFLYYLCLEDCPKLCTEFAACNQNPSTAEAIKKIKLAHTRGDDDLLTSPLKNLSPWNLEEVKCIQRGPTQNICFAGLCQIKVIGCHKLKQLFATKLATSFPKLKRLIVRRCNELEVIMVEDRKEDRANNANTEMIAKVGFENLRVLHVSNCKKLKTVFSTFIPLPELDTLLLQSNAVLESLFGQSDSDCTSHWTRLNVLSVTSCPKLCAETIAIVKSQSQPQANMPPIQRRRIINLSNIQGVEELVQFQRQDGGDVDQKTWFQRQILKVEELGDLKRIWSGPTRDISFSYLSYLRVKGCSRLKQLFTTTMATSLHNLALLSVERCHELEQVIEEGNEESNIQSVQQLKFSSLVILRLIDLPNLISFCPTSCNLVFSSMKEKNLKVKGCSKLVTDFLSKQSYREYGGPGYLEDDYDYEGEDGEEDEFEFKDEDKNNTDKFACALFGLRYKNQEIHKLYY